ncbi:MAG: hypothetical protein KBT01_05050 [Clostridiales bacterium]|nr:hypothetical protein [Candidatus Blautia equi]
MAMNPMMLLKIKGMLDGFNQRHPRVLPFAKDASGRIQEGSILEVTVTDPSGHSITSNIRVTAEDMELIRQSKDFLGNMNM